MATMRIEFEQNDRELLFDLSLDEGDNSGGAGQLDKNIHLVDTSFRFVLPFATDMHPDLLATALLWVVLPFVGRRVEMPRPVSGALADIVYQAFEIELEPVNAQLQPREPGSRPGLAFSGGVDSLASLLLMPEDTVLGFFERVAHPEVAVPADYNTYDTAAALQACAYLEQEGRDVFRVQSDHEYIIGPIPDRATWLGAGTQLVLLADALDLDSASFGVALDSTYLTDWDDHQFFSWDTMYEDPKEYPWENVMSAIGLPIARPVGGIAEVGTTKIVAKSQYQEISTSCADGLSGQACMRCKKCLRKSLLEAVLNNEMPDNSFWWHFAELPEIRDYLSDGTLIDINLEYCLQKLEPIPNMYFARIQEASQSASPDLSFLERWYPRSIEHIPGQYQDFFIQEKNKYFQDYTAGQIEQLENWQPVPLALPDPGLTEVVVTKLGRKVRGAKRRVTNLIEQVAGE